MKWLMRTFFISDLQQYYHFHSFKHQDGNSYNYYCKVKVIFVQSLIFWLDLHLRCSLTSYMNVNQTFTGGSKVFNFSRTHMDHREGLSGKDSKNLVIEITLKRKSLLHTLSPSNCLFSSDKSARRFVLCKKAIFLQLGMRWIITHY